MKTLLISYFLIASCYSFSQFEDGHTPIPIFGGTNVITTNAAGQAGVKSASGKELIPFVYSRIIENNLGLFVFKINKSNGYERSYSLGYYNRQLKQVLPCQYNSLLALDEGYIIASQNSDRKFGLIDTIGRIIIPFEYEEMAAPSEGLYLTKLKGKYGFINKKNHIIVEHKFTYASPFSEGLAAASRGGLIGYINRKGDFEIREQFSSADDFSYGYAQVFFHNQTSVIDKNGVILFPFVFRSIRAVGNGQFVFEAGDNLRNTLTSTLPKLGIAQTPEELSQYDSLVSSTDSEIDSETLEEKFMGVLNLSGQLIGGNEFQQVVALLSKDEKQLYAVQRRANNEENYNQGYHFALMDGNGKLLTDFRFFEVKPEEGIVIEETEKGFVSYHVAVDGKLTPVN